MMVCHQSHVAVAVLIAVAAGYSPPPMSLHLLGAGEGGNACLDGSPYGFYLRRNQSSNDWVIHMAGGGWCDSLETCATKEGVTFTSLSFEADHDPASGLLSGSSILNPLYYHYNAVFLPYCDGSCFTSHQDKPVTTGVTKDGKEVMLHMRGNANLYAALTALRRDFGMQFVRNLIIHGDSAGGTSVFLHVDSIATFVGAAITVGLPDGGALPNSLVNTECCKFEDLARLHNSLSSLPAQCVGAQAPGQEWRCFTMTVLQPFVRTPLFIVQSQFDHFQLMQYMVLNGTRQRQIPCVRAQVFLAPWITSPDAVCTDDELAVIEQFGKEWNADYQGYLAMEQVGIFAPACVGHINGAPLGWATLSIQGIPLRDAFAEWHQSAARGSGGRRHWIEDCRRPCNKHKVLCAPMKQAPSILKSGESLAARERLVSADGRFRLDVEHDGHLTIHEGAGLWSSRGANDDLRLRLQHDGNLVVYDGDRAIWKTGTISSQGSYWLELQNDGNLVLHKGPCCEFLGSVMWASLSAQTQPNVLKAGQTMAPGHRLVSLNKRFYVEVDDGGTLVVNEGSAIWSSRRDATKRAATNMFSLMLLRDGNIVVFKGKQEVWSSGKTGPDGDYWLEIQDDGNLVEYKGAYDGEREVVWATGTDVASAIDDSMALVEAELKSSPAVGGDGANNSTVGTIILQQRQKDAFELEMKVACLPILLLEMAVFCAGDSPEALPREPLPVSYDSNVFEVLRFIGVLHVAFFHESISRPDGLPWHRFAAFGRYWVQFFFVLSGFVLGLSQKDALQVKSRHNFVWRRLRGAYPGYLAGMLLGLVANTAGFLPSLRAFIGAFVTPPFLMMESWLPPFGVGSPNGPAWFLCSLLYFWLRFPDWYPLTRVVGWQCLLFAWLSSWLLPLLYLQQGLQTNFAAFHPFSHWPSFVFGLSLWQCVTWCKNISIAKSLAGTLSFAVLVVVMLSIPELRVLNIGYFIDSNGPLLLIVFGTLIAFVPFGQDLFLRPSWLVGPKLSWLGAVSGSMFVLHWPVRQAVVLRWPTAPVAAVLASQFLAASVFHELQERCLGKPKRTNAPQSADFSPVPEKDEEEADCQAEITNPAAAAHRRANKVGPEPFGNLEAETLGRME